MFTLKNYIFKIYIEFIMYLKLITFTSLVAFSIASQAQVNCVRPIKSIATSATTIDIDHGDGYQRSVMSLNWNDNDQDLMSRTLSIVLAASLAGKDVRFTYSSAHNGTGASCKPVLIQKLTSVQIIL